MIIYADLQNVIKESCWVYDWHPRITFTLRLQEQARVTILRRIPLVINSALQLVFRTN